MLRKRGWARVAIIGVFFVALAFAGVHAHSFIFLDAGAFRTAAEPLLARAREISERARPEYQDLALATLPPNAYNRPYYRLDDRLHEAEAVEEPALVSSPERTVVHAFEFEDAGHPDLISPESGRVPPIEDGVLEIRGHDGFGYLTNADPLAVLQDDIGDIVIRGRASQPTWMTLGWSKDALPNDVWRDSIDVQLIGDGEFHTYVINGRNALRRGLAPGEKLAHLFVRPSMTSGTDVELDFIRFLSRRSRYLASANGQLYESLGGEMRKVLHMLPNQTLQWTIDVPNNSPSMNFGNGVLMNGHPVKFEVLLATEGENATLHAQTLTSAAGWHDRRLDLSPWAGRKVAIKLKVTGDQENVALWSSPRIQSAPNERFNVIIVLEDALRADYLSSHGSALDTSPNKSRLMKERGIQFDWAISQATKTRPSVPTLMTSLYPTATGVWHFSDMLSDRYLTLAEIMRSQGFATASFIQNGNAGPWAGLHQGFSELYDPQIMGNSTEAIFGERVFGWLERHAEENFFLYLHAIDPHGPYDPKPPFDAWYQEMAGKSDPVARLNYLEPSSVAQPTAEGRRRRYAGEIRHNDSLLQSLVEKLDDLGLTENTLLVLLADHGEYMGEHGLWEHRPPGRMPVIHVPLMMTYPGRFKTAERIADPVQLIDVMPTILELAGIDAEDLLLQGDSLVSLIEGRDSERWRDRVVISEEPEAMLKRNPCRCGSIIHRDLHVVSSTRLWPKWVRDQLPRLRAHMRTAFQAFRSDEEQQRRADDAPGQPNDAQKEREAPAPNADLIYLRWLGHDLISPRAHAFLKTLVYEFRGDATEERALQALVPDLYVRWLAYDLLSELQETNMITAARLTEGETVDPKLDPDTLEHLKGLGYVN